MMNKRRGNSYNVKTMELALDSSCMSCNLDVEIATVGYVQGFPHNSRTILLRLLRDCTIALSTAAVKPPKQDCTTASNGGHRLDNWDTFISVKRLIRHIRNELLYVKKLVASNNIRGIFFGQDFLNV